MQMKKRFKFSLEPVEVLRKAKENEALRVLALAQTKFQQALEFKQSLINELETSLVRREQLAENAHIARDFQMESQFILGIKQRMIQSDQFILRSRKGVEKAMREFLQARRQTRAIEILREKAFNEYKTQLRKSEQKELDDLYVMRARFNEVNKESA